MDNVWADRSKNSLSGGKQVPVGSNAESEELIRLERQIQDVEMDYEKYAEEHLDFEKPVEKQKDEVSKTNRLFCLAMAGLCLSPLRKGVSSKSVLRVVGLWVGCCFLSKSFRQEVNRVVTDAIYPVISKKASKAKTNSMLEQRKTMIKGDDTTLPLTPDSIAVMKIAFCKQAYLKMHEPNADVAGILDKYNAASDKLYEMAIESGIRPALVDKSMRKIAADLIDKDSSFVPVFTETAYDMVVRADDTVHTQKYMDGDIVKERTYTSWEGAYHDEFGNQYDGVFTPRCPASVNELRMRSKHAWDRTMASAGTPEEWGDAVTTPEARQIQQKYLYLIKVDHHLDDEQLGDLNALMDPEDDVTWLVDIDGDDPFCVGSIDDTFVEIVTNGPKPDSTQMVLGTYPEFKSAYCRWLNHHPDVSPMAQQKKANAAYYEYAARGKKDDLLLQTVFNHMESRDLLQQRWDNVFDVINERINQVNSANQLRLQEVKRSQRALPGTDKEPAMDLGIMRNL